ncbi:MAG: bifunctional (p)ppGpp synthetase/guanosine-3',5'-bis(diphosphate) 3'-pyrophosphohydrolase, partial [Tritonibacter mobilis]|nr:bifunctional (p)ppGpp synthetase/guanosine-3',5'-bis(diphosphate) 3'-pyrophosphohydrolase [Tritonibacter mobilis]
MTSADDLISLVRDYNPKTNEQRLRDAFAFGEEMHEGQFRHSGEPYFTHPVAVAAILTEQRLDDATIITALLHDTIEDTKANFEEVSSRFGEEVAMLVDGVTKLTNLQLSSRETKQAENFRKLFMAMSKDLRVILVKLADRLHNMRTIRAMRPEKQAQKARETMDIYAPLAERIGMQRFKDELENLAFQELNPDAHNSILTRLEFLKREGEDVPERIVEELRHVLAAAGIEVWVSGRIKAPSSIWRKMQRYNVGFEQLSDIMAFRIVVGSIADCYQTLGELHSKYPVVPGRFKDYISIAKPNGYRSLHTGLIGPERQRIEVQIRTREMHEIAELGVAAHWKYKQGTEQVDGRQYRWLRELLDILEQASNPEEFLEHTKLEMFQDQVFCFTP